jgi:hypothetical protein
VTSRQWRDRDDWLKLRRQQKKWAGIRAIDADDLVTWLERAPSVYLWISEQLGREPRDIRTPDVWWDRWISQTRIVLPHSFLLAGRDEVVTQIRDALGQPPRPVTVVGPSQEEALAIVCASLLGNSDEVDELRARAVTVSAPGAWDRLVDSDNALVLIPNFDDADITSAVRKGRHVVIPLGRDARQDHGHIVVPLLDRGVAAEAILDEAAGITRDVANHRAAHAYRNLLSLRRTLAVNPRFAGPPWSEGEQGRRLAPLVLAGSWSDDIEGDRTAIEMLTGRSYAEIEGDLAAWAAQDDAPVMPIGQAWRIVSKEDAWDLVAPLITKTTLTRFHKVAVQILEEHDPALDVPPERRFMAAVVGEPRTWSPRLRQGLAHTAAFLGGYVADTQLADGATGERHAQRIARAVTERANADPAGRAWQSLADVLPLLAEAAPDAVLDAVEVGLGGTRPCCARSSSAPSWGRRSAPRRPTSAWSGHWRLSPGRPRTGAEPRARSRAWPRLTPRRTPTSIPGLRAAWPTCSTCTARRRPCHSRAASTSSTGCAIGHLRRHGGCCGRPCPRVCP